MGNWYFVTKLPVKEYAEKVSPFLAPHDYFQNHWSFIFPIIYNQVDLQISLIQI